MYARLSLAAVEVTQFDLAVVVTDVACVCGLSTVLQLKSAACPRPSLEVQCLWL